MLNQKTLKKYLDYDPETGIFKWKIARTGIKIGDVVGHLHKTTGYVYIRLLGKRYSGHRLAWLYVHGKFPDNQIDHINRVKNDNRIDNLRDVTQSVNARNRDLLSTNTSGHTGVKWNKKQQAWKVTVCQVHYGSFKSKLDAVAKVKSVHKKLGFHENHGRACND
jgi:hypothetical protein